MSSSSLKILVAVNQKEESIYALSWCLKNIVMGNDVTMIALYVILNYISTPVVSSAYHSRVEELMISSKENNKYLIECIMNKINTVKDEIPLGVDLKIKVEIGNNARDVICNAVEKFGCNMLVTGFRGHGALKALKRLFHRSVSDYCARKAPCSVLIVKKPRKKNVQSSKS